MPQPGSICIFEDDQADRLFPLTYMRPVFDLRCGAVTLRERIARFFPESAIYLKCRDYLAPLVHEQNPDFPVNVTPAPDCLFINAGVIMDDRLFSGLREAQDATLICRDKIIAYYSEPGAGKKEIEADVITYPWDLIKYNAKALIADFNAFPKKQEGRCCEGAVWLRPSDILTGEGTVIKPGAVIDAESGPVMIGRNVTIMPNAVIEGPCFIGDNAVIKIGAKIYGSTSIGPVCKIGGEVEGSVFHAYSNKQHDGFVGHSYISEWCNLGADTNTSDLKNNYSNVKVTVNGIETDTGSKFVGLTMGDHSKSGINTMFNTGTVAGVSSNIFGGGFPPKTIPSFAWVNVPVIEEYQLNKAVEVARIVMNRRKIDMTRTYEELMRYIFKLTERERLKKCG